ncbi:MAG: hypothetical protein JOZ39_05900 [Chloroflexi bacterium]|nr:hypothetical protein [Chloroflexota bacterium]
MTPFFDDEEILSPALHALLGLAIVDRSLQDLLLSDPGAAVRDFHLTPLERRAVRSVRRQPDLIAFSMALERAFQEQRRQRRGSQLKSA